MTTTDLASTAETSAPPSIVAFDRTGFASPRFRNACSTICIAAAGLCVASAWLDGLAAFDTIIFVTLLLVADLGALYGIQHIFRFLARNSLPFFRTLGPAPDQSVTRYVEFCGSIMNSQRMSVAGLGYGAVAAGYLLSETLLPRNSITTLMFAAFFFTTHFITGAGVYSLYHFVRQSYHNGNHAPINLWQIDSPTTRFLLRSNRRVALLSSMYVSVCMFSLLFAKQVLNVDHLVIYYALASALVVVLSIVIPSLPLILRIQEKKSTALDAVDQQIETEFERTLESLHGPDSTADTKRLECLLQLRDKIAAINAWPFKAKSIATVASVLFLTGFPAVVKVLVERALAAPSQSAPAASAPRR